MLAPWLTAADTEGSVNRLSTQMRTLAPTALQGLRVGGRAPQGTRASRVVGPWRRQARRGGAAGAARVGAPARTGVTVRAADQGAAGATAKGSADEGGLR